MSRTIGVLEGIVAALNEHLANPIDFYEGWFESHYYYESDLTGTYAAQQQYVGSCYGTHLRMDIYMIVIINQNICLLKYVVQWEQPLKLIEQIQSIFF